jgi:hypothetical protein
MEDVVKKNWGDGYSFIYSKKNNQINNMIFEKDTIMFVKGGDKHSSAPPDGFPNRFAILTWFDCNGSVPSAISCKPFS